MSKSAHDLAMFHLEVSHLHKLVVKHKAHVTVDGLEKALAALLENHEAKADVVLLASHPDFPPGQRLSP
jgi:hypothetical protein